MSDNVVWGDLDIDVQRAILDKYMDGVDVDSLARVVGLKSSSLSRKIRELQAQLHSGEVTRIFDRIEINRETRVMVYGDTHFPVADPLALECAIKIRKLFSPEVIINLGDTLDLYTLSKFHKLPDHKSDVQDEIEKWKSWASRFYSGFSGGSYFVSGNHDKRLEKAISSIAGLGTMEALRLESILSTRDYGCDNVSDLIVVNGSEDDVYSDGLFYFYHGDVARRGSGSSARALSDKLSGSSVMMGHAHRTAVTIGRNMRGLTKSYECGTLALLNPEYDIFPDWSQSVFVGVIDRGYVDFTPIIIDRGSFNYGGVRYHA